MPDPEPDTTKLVSEIARLRNELEYSVMVESWEECNQIVGLLSAHDIEAVICKARVKRVDIDGTTKVEKRSGVAIPEYEFDKLRRLLANAI